MKSSLPVAPTGWLDLLQFQLFRFGSPGGGSNGVVLAITVEVVRWCWTGGGFVVGEALVGVTLDSGRPLPSLGLVAPIGVVVAGLAAFG